MKTISDYTIYCTEDQTKNALELGAPITYQMFTHEPLFIPTSEQMIGFLLDNGITDIVVSRKMNPHTFGFNVWYGMHGLIQEKRQYPTRKEATLAAIDAALEYLTNNKK